MSKEKTYKDLEENDFVVQLNVHDISKYEVLFHVTLKESRKKIEEEGLKRFMPQYKSLVETDLIFLSYPINMNTGDCFRWSDEYCSLIVLDAKTLRENGFIFYDDPFGQKDRSSLRNHLCTDRDIPKKFIKKILEFEPDHV